MEFVIFIVFRLLLLSGEIKLLLMRMTGPADHLQLHAFEMSLAFVKGLQRQQPSKVDTGGRDVMMTALYANVT